MITTHKLNYSHITLGGAEAVVHASKDFWEEQAASKLGNPVPGMQVRV